MTPRLRTGTASRSRTRPGRTAAPPRDPRAEPTERQGGTWRAGGGAVALLFALLITGCGGGQRGGDTAPTTGAPTAATAGDGAAHDSSEMVSADTMDEINRRLERKRQMVSRCLASAIDNKELPKSSAGKITVEIVIAPNGKADTVHVIRSTLESKTLTECVINRIKEIQFPEVSKPYETSYTYGFEAM